METAPNNTPQQSPDPDHREFTARRRTHWDAVARDMDKYGGAIPSYYRKFVGRIYRFLVPPGRKVLELGCGTGDLLASLEPSRGLGVDFSPEMTALARKKHPGLEFLEQDVHDLDPGEKFDVVILSDLVNDLWDVQQVLKNARRACHDRTRIILNFYSQLWEKPLKAAERFGLSRPKLQQNWLTVHDADNLLRLSDMETIKQWDEFLFPFPVPVVGGLFNRYLGRIWPFRFFDLCHFMVARPRPEPDPKTAEPVVSVVVPARNEAGNIEKILERVPEMGAGTELIFVEGGSGDNTYEAIEQAIPKFPNRKVKLMRQPGKGKGDAVRAGYAEATGDVLMILDADMTVPPEDLPLFYEALRTGKGEFINGVRLVYPMGEKAMRFLNFLGNKFFSLAFTFLLGVPVKDTLCGTKVLTRSDYELLAANRDYFGDFDPFGDFDLLFGAAKMNLKIADLPIRYRDRTYGDTNINRWSHGWLLLKMVAFAARRIKFI